MAGRRVDLRGTRLQAGRPIVIHGKSDGGLHQSSGSQDGKERTDLTVLTGMHPPLFFTHLVPHILQILYSLGCLPYPQTRAGSPTTPQHSSGYLHSLLFSLGILDLFLRLFDQCLSSSLILGLRLFWLL